MKIKKVDDKPMVIHTKEKAKIHAHEPKGAKIKGSNIYTVERGPKTIGVKVSDDKKKSYRKSTIHQSESKNKRLSRFERNYRESNTSIKTKNTNLHIAGRTGALAAGAVTEQMEGGQEVSQAAYLAYEANDVFEICSYVDGLEKKIDSMTEELTNMQNQIKEMQEDTLINNAKKALSEAKERLNARCEQIKSQVLEVKAQVKSTAKSIVDKAKEKGRSALYRLSEFLGIKKRLLDIRENVRGAIKTTDKDIAKTELLAKGFREAGQTVTNAFRTFADKPEVDYSQKEQKHPITKAVLAPMKAVKKMLVLMEIHLDASIDKLDNLAMDVQLDKEKHMENAKAQKQTEPERAEAERVEAEVVYAPMVAEPQEYQYNADAFEARGVDEVKQEAAHKEAPKVRDDKAR